MTEKEKKQLESIKKQLVEGTYPILQKNQWDKFSRDLSNYGANLLKEIEHERNCIREFNLSFFFFQGRKQLRKLDSDYEQVAKNFDLFFDASMRWLKSIINTNKYEEYQTLQRKYVESLTMHCCQALDYLGNLVSSKRNQYYHYQTLFLAVLAVFIGFLSIIISIII